MQIYNATPVRAISITIQNAAQYRQLRCQKPSALSSAFRSAMRTWGFLRYGSCVDISIGRGRDSPRNPFHLPICTQPARSCSSWRCCFNRRARWILMRPLYCCSGGDSQRPSGMLPCIRLRREARIRPRRWWRKRLLSHALLCKRGHQANNGRIKWLRADEFSRWRSRLLVFRNPVH
jgi:hypothetical protein